MKRVLFLSVFFFFLTLGGEEVAQNPEKTLMNNYIKACSDDSAFACFRVADCYSLGKVVKKDIKKAEEYNLKGAYILEINCFNGLKDDCVYLANMYEVGKAVPTNYELAAKMYNNACLAGSCKACERLFVLRYEAKISADSPYLICEESTYRY